MIAASFWDHGKLVRRKSTCMTLAVRGYFPPEALRCTCYANEWRAGLMNVHQILKEAQFLRFGESEMRVKAS